MKEPYFIMLRHPNGEYFMPLVDSRDDIMQFGTEQAAKKAALGSSLGFEVGFEVFDFRLGMKMKDREELILETIELERQLMVYKKGLHLAKKFIEVHRGDPDLSDEMIEANLAYRHHLVSNGLEDI